MINRINSNSFFKAFESLKKVYRAVVLRFFTSEEEIKKFDVERVRGLSLIEVRFLSVKQIHLIGLHRFSQEQVKVREKDFSVEVEKVKSLGKPIESLFNRVFKAFETENPEEKESVRKDLLKEETETHLLLLTMAEKTKRYTPIVFLVQALLSKETAPLTHQKEAPLKRIASYMSKECFSFVVQRIASSPLIKKLNEAIETFEEEDKERFLKVEGVTKWMRSSQRKSSQKFNCTKKEGGIKV
jgi:hypothetical protein